MSELSGLFQIMADAVPVLVWMSGPDKLCTYFNKQWLDFTGRSVESQLGNGWAEGVHPDDLQKCLETYAQAFDRREPFGMEYRLRRHDRAYRWVLDTGVPLFNADGTFVGYIGSCVDVTDFKRADHERSLATERLQLAMESGRSVGWEWDLKTGEDTWFGDLQTMFGVPGNTYVGNVQDFRTAVHPDDRTLVWKAVDDAMGSRKPYAAEFRVRWPDGTVRWVAAQGKFYYSPDGEPDRMLGMAVDITERKFAEEALSTVSRRLIEAQEAERARIARDLHDDIGQRVALLGMTLDQLKSLLPDRTGDVRRYMDALQKQTGEIASAVQALSYDLHSSQLEYLGVVAAMRAFCAALSRQHKVEIEFGHANVPPKVPAEISLCLFRVLQEALHNAVRHSAVRQFDVRLRGTTGAVQLTVSDRGRGFDPKAAPKGRGLGLTSMQERLKLVGGELSIESQPGRGTTVLARVPIPASHL